jgi:predicted 3-demethylubiquinone-9 3-methyltransferase (glyoxalase superfamily)
LLPGTSVPDQRRIVDGRGEGTETEAALPKQKITTFLWYDANAEEAAKYYTSIFENSKIQEVTRYGEGGPGPKGSVMTVRFLLDGVEFTALNGGPQFKFSEAISLVVHCENQKEVDAFWSKLSAGGEEGPCGWLKDKFGLSWQVVPTALPKMLSDKEPKTSQRVMSAVMQMKKLDIAKLEEAYRGK